MRGTIEDTGMLNAIQPAALTAYAQSMGWKLSKRYRANSDVYTADGRPEIVLPRTQNLADYARVMSQLIDIFASEADLDQLSIYRQLVVANRDVIRIRTVDDEDRSSITIADGVNLMQGTREMILAAACSLKSPRPLYRTGAHQEANEFLNRMRVGPIEQGSFVITLHSPVIAPIMHSGPTTSDIDDEPFERRVTQHLALALRATREAADLTTLGRQDVFRQSISQGVSANLCEAIVMLIGSFSTVDTSISWAHTRPVPRAHEVFRFGPSDAPILQEASRTLRSKEPRPDVVVFGMVQKLSRDELDLYGTVWLRAYVDDRIQTVVSVLDQFDYDRAIHAHSVNMPLVLNGDLERVGQRWRLLNPRVLDIIDKDEDYWDPEIK
ncbi:MAG: hypothetical protein OXL98_08150 [Acidimicrobiaceae bacterium]|nr:hypothetical protein [Acidimicrobiaceae bacterium]